MNIMKIFFICLFGLINTAYAIEPDKQKHIMVSFAIPLAVYPVVKNRVDNPLLYAGTISLMVGVGKEVYDDSNGGRFSGSDVLHDVYGTALGLGLVYMVDELID